MTATLSEGKDDLHRAHALLSGMHETQETFPEIWTLVAHAEILVMGLLRQDRPIQTLLLAIPLHTAAVVWAVAVALPVISRRIQGVAEGAITTTVIVETATNPVAPVCTGHAVARVSVSQYAGTETLGMSESSIEEIAMNEGSLEGTMIVGATIRTLDPEPL